MSLKQFAGTIPVSYRIIQIQRAMRELVKRPDYVSYVESKPDTSGIYVQGPDGITLMRWKYFSPATLEKFHILLRDGAIADDFTEAQLDDRGDAIDPSRTTWISDIVDVRSSGHFVLEPDYHLPFQIREDGRGLVESTWTGDEYTEGNGGIHQSNLPSLRERVSHGGRGGIER